MDEKNWMSERFAGQRARLRAVAFRMLGSPTEADDAVQEAWLRLSRADTSEVANLGGWLTTVVARVCLDMLRSRSTRSEVPFEGDAADAVLAREERGPDPEQEALLADSMGPALTIVLETLAPAERLAFVLHDLFGVSFEEIGGILARSPTAARQLASRARRRVRGADADADADSTAGAASHREIVDAFLAASRNGRFDALVAVLDPDVVLRVDPAAVRAATARAAHGAPQLAEEVRGAAAVAGVFSGRAQAAEAALIDGAAGAVWAPGGVPRVAFIFKTAGGKIVEMEIVSEPARFAELEVMILKG
jgi:RNA polymerase sigma factor (sigma-70 family)